MGTVTSSGSMETVSGRIPDELYHWFASLKVEGAVTNSDKLRLLLGQLKRQHEGSIDYVSALSWFRDLTAPLRVSLSRIEHDEAVHSEVLTTLIEHVCALSATLVSAHPADKQGAMEIEETVVRRVFAMGEGLLRQALTTNASAFDPKVVRRHSTQTTQLAKLLK